MDNPKNRYKQMEKYMTLALIGNAILFIVYLIAAGTGVIWLKVVSSIIAMIVSVLCLVYLYLTKLLTRPQSLWMTTAAGAILVCILFSLILNFPSPL